MGYLPIDQYGVIGDLHTAALVGRNGSIDWLCLPRFDSPSVFGAILDDKKGGRFKISAINQTATRQLYVPDTNVLITRFITPDGLAEIYDCMPIESDERGSRALVHDLIRVVHCVRGTVELEAICQPAFNYARTPHTVRSVQHGCVFLSEGDRAAQMSLLASVPLTLRQGSARARFRVHEGDWVGFVLEWVNGRQPSTMLPPTISLRRKVQQTVDYWQRWVTRSTYRGRWREHVARSALALKLLTYAPTGAIIAAPTTSLPEAIGGPRNWDYRYSWVRDSSFIVYALMRIGFNEEAARYIDFLTTRCLDVTTGKSLQVVYRIDGSTDLDEEVLDHLEGYRGTRPVRIGNAAKDQLQLDIFGELLDSIYLYDKYGSPISYDVWKSLTWLLNWLCDNWQQPDDGIWEVRGGRQCFVFSRMMCWVAYDRALRMANKRGLPAPRTRWEDTRTAIYEDVMAHGYDAKLGTFVQYYGAPYVDASNLLMPLVKFIAPTDPRMLSTIEETRHLLVSDSLVYRYDPRCAAPDGLTGGEGAFSICTFWWVEALTRAGYLREARLTFEKMLTYANPLGLYAEEIGHSAEALGNFPQGFTHLALISAAFNLDRALDSPHLWSPRIEAPLLGPA
ncbi:MAG TPA: glycoside hydrolase family 15 protein [Chloroflexota bacterium]|nr:glycoside hydrolase family 15 protein [Chloroflexota bacterium]